MRDEVTQKGGKKKKAILENDVRLSVTHDSEEFLWKTGSIKEHEGNVQESGTKQNWEQPIRETKLSKGTRGKMGRGTKLGGATVGGATVGGATVGGATVAVISARQKRCVQAHFSRKEHEREKQDTGNRLHHSRSLKRVRGSITSLENTKQTNKKLFTYWTGMY